MLLMCHEYLAKINLGPVSDHTAICPFMPHPSVLGFALGAELGLLHLSQPLACRSAIWPITLELRANSS